MEIRNSSVSLSLDALQPSQEGIKSATFTDVHKKLTKKITKLKTVIQKEAHYDESMKQLKESDIFQKVQEEKQEKLNSKIEDMNFRDKMKIENWNKMIEQSRRATERKIQAIAMKRQALKDQLIKLDLEEESINAGFEDYKRGCDEEIERVYEKNGVKTQQIEIKKEKTEAPISLAEQKKLIQMETEKKQVGGETDEMGNILLQVMRNENKNKQKDMMEYYRLEEEKERIRQYEEKEQYMRNKAIEEAREERVREDRRKANQKQIQNIMDNEGCSYADAQNIFLYGKQKEEKQHRTSFFGTYMNAVEFETEDSLPNSKETKDEIYEQVLDSLENDCETPQERKQYLAGLKWLKTKPIPAWFETKLKALLI